MNPSLEAGPKEGRPRKPIHHSPDQVLNAPASEWADYTLWDVEGNRPLDIPHAESLAPSIEKHGLLQHLRARLDEELGLIPVIGQHRAYTLIYVLKHPVIPYIPVFGNPTLAQRREWRFVEDNERKAMTPMERARMAIAIRDDNAETNVEVARRLNILCSSVVTDFENWITVLDEHQQAALDSGELKASYASELCRCRDEPLRRELFAKVISGEIASRDALKAAVHAQKGGARPYHRKEGEDGSDKIRVVHPRTGQVFVIDTARPFEHYKAAYGFVARLFQDKDVNSFDDLKTRLG